MLGQTRSSEVTVAVGSDDELPDVGIRCGYCN
jgi:hypothetical protein